MQALLEELRRVPDECKAVAVEQVAQFRRLTELRPVHMVGEDGDDEAEAGISEGEVTAPEQRWESRAA